MDLHKTLENVLSSDNEIRKNAEINLIEMQNDRHYSHYILNLLENSQHPIVKLASAIVYKNHMKDTNAVRKLLLAAQEVRLSN